MDDAISRRSLLRGAALTAASLLVSGRLDASALPGDAPETDRERLARWLRTLRAEGAGREGAAFGRSVARAGELALGMPYRAHTLEAYLADSPPSSEPLTLRLDGFDCVTLVESALAVARAARSGPSAGWAEFAREVERMRYREGLRTGYASRLHYFSEWILDGSKRGLVRDIGKELGGEEDRRPLRFMTEHRSAYAALKDDVTFAAIGEMERSLDDAPRHVIPTARIPQVQSRIQTGDVLAFATSIAGLDASHTGMAYRDRAGVLRVLHAPLSGGEVEVSRSTLHGYVSAIRRATGVMIARPV